MPLFESKKETNEENKRKPSITGLGMTSLSPSGTGKGVSSTSTSSGMPPGKGDLTSLIGAGLIGALNSNGFSNTSALASNLFAIGSTEESAFNKRLISRYGSYLIISLIKPNEVVEDWETFGTIISMVVQWFHMVCYIPSDSSGEIISKLRTKVINNKNILHYPDNLFKKIYFKFILPWIKAVADNHFELITSCLLPIPADFAKVGGVWETKSNKSVQIKEEFAKFCDLITYEIVNYDVKLFKEIKIIFYLNY